MDMRVEEASRTQQTGRGWIAGQPLSGVGCFGVSNMAFEVSGCTPRGKGQRDPKIIDGQPRVIHHAVQHLLKDRIDTAER